MNTSHTYTARHPYLRSLLLLPARAAVMHASTCQWVPLLLLLLALALALVLRGVGRAVGQQQQQVCFRLLSLTWC